MTRVPPPTSAQRFAAWRPTGARPVAAYAGAVLLLAGAYYVAAKLGLKLAYLHGTVVVTPALLTWARLRAVRPARRTAPEAGVVLVVLVVLAGVSSARDVPYAVFPALIWAALRLGPPGAAAAILLTASVTVWNTAHNAGPFVRTSITDSLLSTQLFLATTALTSLILAAVTAERERVGEALHLDILRRR